ncbi:MAG TPA: DUF2127 domain-containing protein [Thermoanaerobaculia bacterium]|nr:DUF2127 domain-containing protein [Thermoanaerobaculia bacterium]
MRLKRRRRRGSGHPERGPILLAIIALKYLKAALFLVAGLALFRFRKDPSARWLLRVAERADGDPRLRLTARLLRDLSHSFELHFSAIVASCLIAGVALGCEGTFLARGYAWAPWVTIVLTGMWVPVEAWEVFRRFSVRTLVLMIVNILIVAYLYVHRADFHRHLRE